MKSTKCFSPLLTAEVTTGGAQMHEGYLALTGNYKPGSFRDKLIESFAGTHDLLGGQIWGYYGDDGNTKRGSKPLQGVATGAAIPVSAPFALADLFSSDFFVILLKLGGR